MKADTEEMTKDHKLTIVVLTEAAVRSYRIPRAERGMAFVVDKFSNGVNGMVAHVRDYRFSERETGGSSDYAIWSIGADLYEVAYSVAL